ncbi:hypothetical protein SUDANB95_05918 [Actinosynnema sp. ALI-1.44]
MRLWTVQHAAVLDVLASAGELVGEWDRVVPQWRPAYRVVAARLGVDRPPVWAWRGPDTRDGRVALTAELLLGDHRAGFAVLDLDVPDDVVVLSSYRRWNDFLDAVVFGPGPARMDWTLDPDEPTHATVQACLPVLRASWVLGSRDL